MQTPVIERVVHHPKWTKSSFCYELGSFKNNCLSSHASAPSLLRAAEQPLPCTTHWNETTKSACISMLSSKPLTNSKTIINKLWLTMDIEKTPRQLNHWLSENSSTCLVPKIIAPVPRIPVYIKVNGERDPSWIHATSGVLDILDNRYQISRLMVV